MTENGITKWIEEELISRILDNNDLDGATVQRIKVKELPSMKDNWASDMIEIDLFLEKQGKEKRLSLILKIMNKDEKVRISIHSHAQFFNEIYFYSTLIPLMSSQISSKELKCELEELFPKCFYSYYINNKIPENIEDAVLVMENLKVSDFKLGNRTSLDLKHCTLALKRLGLFHAISYFMKEQDMNTFISTFVKPIKQTKFFPSYKEITDTVFKLYENKIINELEKELPEGDPGLAQLKCLASRNAYDVFIDLAQPHEPLAVLCHGDFLRNNLLFRYENGDPVDIKFIDLQTIRYASPAIDLSLFLCMNTTHELRLSHFDELLHIYHSSLTDVLAALLKKPKENLDKRYSFESFLADFRHHAAYGYLISIEFLPWMLANNEELEEIVKLNYEEKGSPKYNEVALRLGGKYVTQVLVDLATDLINKQCL